MSSASPPAQPAPPPPPRAGFRTREVKRARVIVAIDFGTTFSGVAFANTDEPKKRTVLKEWGRGNKSANKVPTILRYDNGGTTGPFKWGFGIGKRPTDRVHEWFKLGLCPEYEGRRAAESELERDYPSSTALPAVRGEEAEKLAVDYLSGLKKRVDEHFAASFDKLVDEIPRQYIVTVPAIWDHKEQDRTRRCAERAGMGSGRDLQVVSEPEAAAIYALERMPRVGLGMGDTFIICDAGGGTVDLTSYTVRSLDPISLAGVAKGSGGLCGGSFLNRIFEEYLRRKLRGYAGGWDDACLRYSVDEFEGKIKPEFTGDDEQTFSIMLHGLSDSLSHGIQGGYLELDGKELRENVFDKVVTRVQALVRDQIANTGGAKAVLLAGGFGQSSYLKQQLERLWNVIEKGIKVQRIEDSDTAIVRGALIVGLVRNSTAQEGILRVRDPRVESRIAGRSYGTRAWQFFREGEDDHNRRHIQPTGEYLVDRMQWFVKEGDSIQDGAPETFHFQKERDVADGPIDTIEVEIYSCEKRDTGGVADPKYPDDPGVRRCASFQVDIRRMKIPVETPDGAQVYVVKLDIEMTLDSASLSFCGVFGKKRTEPKMVQFV